jgi:hypothetical protein
MMTLRLPRFTPRSIAACNSGPDMKRRPQQAVQLCLNISLNAAKPRLRTGVLLHEFRPRGDVER